MGEAEANHSRDPRKINLGEERILLGKIAEGGRSEPLNSCFCLHQLRSSGGLRPQSFFAYQGQEASPKGYLFLSFLSKIMPFYRAKKLTETCI